MSDTIIEKIVAAKRKRIESAKERVDIVSLARSAFQRRRTARANRLSSVLQKRESVNVIAEIKRASPSKGVINDLTDVSNLAMTYEKAGAAAISVLTEEDHFRGSIDDLRKVRSVVDIPILQKDFFIDEFQIFEAAEAGADAILLIAAALSRDALINLQKTADDLGLSVVVEVHDEGELQIAQDIEAKIIGVNNRNLKTFEVSLDVSRKLAASARNEALLVSESGISTNEEVSELRRLGYSGFLIGDSLMRSGDPGSAIKELTSTDTDVVEFSTTQ